MEDAVQDAQETVADSNSNAKQTEDGGLIVVTLTPAE